MQERMIESFDGTKLFTRVDEAAKPKAVVVIAHGLAEHLNRYDALTAELLQNNYTVYRYDQRGHARSEGERVYFSNFNEMPDDLKTVVDLAKSENNHLPILLIGHSMGGMTVALFGTKYPEAVAGIVTSGAVTRMNRNTFGQLPIDSPEDTYLDNNLGDGVCSDLQVVREYEQDPLVEKQISVGLINNLAKGIVWLKESPQLFVAPALILHGADDGIVSEKDSRDFFGDIASEDKTLKIYAKLYHEIFNEPVKYKIYQEVIDWLDEHV